jgi:hypothetical protein
MAEAQITGVERKTTTTGKTYFSVKCSDGRTYTTWDASVDALHGKHVTFDVDTKTKGTSTYYNMKNISVVGNGGGAASVGSADMPFGMMAKFASDAAFKFRGLVLQNAIPPEEQPLLKQALIEDYWDFVEGFSKNPKETPEEEPPV